LHGRRIAIDASMAIYQFLIAVRSNGGPGGGGAAQMLTNEDGETTSHIQGMFNRTIRFLTEGIKPVYVFDGKPPQIKSGELQKRREKRQAAQMALTNATESGDVAEQDKHAKRLVRAGQKENDDCKRLLTLMGVPVICAPCEAEAQASAINKDGQTYATATEDMDALTFATTLLVRKMAFANQSKSVVQTINYAAAIQGLQLTHDQFVDLCILLGCDYCDTIRGVGPKTALKLMREHGSIEAILQNINRQKFTIPADWEPNNSKTPAAAAASENDKDDDNESGPDAEDEDDDDQEKAGKNKSNDDDDNDEQEEDELFIPAYVQARKLFHEHPVLEKAEVASLLKWKPCQVAELTQFLVQEQGFNPDRVKSNIEKLQAAYKANLKPQARMESFFQVVQKPASSSSSSSKPAGAAGKKENANNKRKPTAAAAAAAAKKKGKGGGATKKR
jgi:flap endonuclease-1